MTRLPDPPGMFQSRAPDALRLEDAIRRHRALVEELAAIGGHVAYATHDDVHFYVPEDRAEEGRAIMECYLQDHVRAMMNIVPSPLMNVEPEGIVWLDGDLVCDHPDPKHCSGCQTLAKAIEGA